MLRVMLCGAADISDLAESFDSITKELGGESVHFINGNVSYRNSSAASWETNSRNSVLSASLCVFVIVKRYGELTWNVELKQALSAGTQFIILCLDSTYSEFLALNQEFDDWGAIKDAEKKNLLEFLSEIDNNRRLTICQFKMTNFAEVYRRESAKLFDAGLRFLSDYDRRNSLHILMKDSGKMSAQDLALAEEIARDELEEKSRRKFAIQALANRRSANPDLVLDLLESREQGVQRICVDRLSDLYNLRPASLDFLEDCVRKTTESDDVGLSRRLVPALFEIDVALAVRASIFFDFTEIGTRRRLAAQLLDNEYFIRNSSDLTEVAAELLTLCVRKTEDAGWIQNARDLLTRLRNSNPE